MQRFGAHFAEMDSAIPLPFIANGFVAFGTERFVVFMNWFQDPACHFRPSMEV